MENGKIKLVLLLCGHLHIIKIDGNTTHEKEMFYRLQNQQIYMQGLNQMSKKKQKVFCLHLDIPASSAINMFYKQIILQRGLPFEVKIPSARPVDISTLSEVEFNEELEKGYADMHDRRTKNAKKALLIFARIMAYEYMK